MKIGSSYSTKKNTRPIKKPKTIWHHSFQMFSWTASLFFLPNVCYLHATVLSLSSMFSFSLPCPLFLSFFSYLIGQWVDLFNTQHCVFRSIVYHEIICLSWCLWLKGLLLVWQKHLEGKLVNNLNKHIGWGILEILMPPRCVHKMYLNWEIIGGIPARTEGKCVVPMESLPKQSG